MAVALAIITNKRNEVLLQHRDGNAPTNPNKWGLWGGGIEKGESPEVALVRELKEELDIDVGVDQLEFLRVHRGNYFGGNWEGHIFHLLDEGGFRYNLQEGDDLKFVPRGQFDSFDIDSIARPILDDYFQNLS